MSFSLAGLISSLRMLSFSRSYSFFFFFNDTATTEIYPLSLHDALPILDLAACARPWRSGTAGSQRTPRLAGTATHPPVHQDRKSTRLNSSHSQISYAVFCLKKKNTRTAYARVAVQ